jgi:hypothetical protein
VGEPAKMLLDGEVGVVAHGWMEVAEEGVKDSITRMPRRRGSAGGSERVFLGPATRVLGTSTGARAITVGGCTARQTGGDAGVLV